MAIFHRTIGRRSFLKISAASALSLATSATVPFFRASGRANSGMPKVIVLGIDGMDPGLTRILISRGLLPNFARLADMGGFQALATTTPPQSPVAWASFINGAGPGSHGLFDFIHRDPAKQCEPYYSGAKTIPSEGGVSMGDHTIPLDFWPFNHEPGRTVSNRQGTPFWEYLDQAGIPSVFYDLPANYPPTPSSKGNHKCLSGMGVPDLRGTHGTYQFFSDDGPSYVLREGGGQRTRIIFKGNTAHAQLEGPVNTLLKEPQPTHLPFQVHRAPLKKSATIEINGQRVFLKEGQWSDWIRLEFSFSTPFFIPDQKISGIVRFYLQEANPGFKLYVSPINADPGSPAIALSEPPAFVEDISQDLGMFYTTGFQEDHKALSNGIFSDQEFAVQAQMVLDERMRLLEYALDHFHEGLLFFYFSSLDMQSHMFWWDSDQDHPFRSREAAKRQFAHLQDTYVKMDEALGRVMQRFGDEAAILAMSDHGFADFRRQFNLNSWLRDSGYLDPAGSDSILSGANWKSTRAYGLGINGLYINLKGREREGIVSPGSEYDALVEELIHGLEAIQDSNGERVVNRVFRSDRIFKGSAIDNAPDLIMGYSKGYRASWATCLGELSPKVLEDNRAAWSADHCCDPSLVPGVLFSNRSLSNSNPGITDLAPTILRLFGLIPPSSMEGKILLGS